MYGDLNGGTNGTMALTLRLSAADLRGRVDAVAAHREHPVIALAYMPDRQQSYAAMVARYATLALGPRAGRLDADVIRGQVCAPRP